MLSHESAYLGLRSFALRAKPLRPRLR